MKVFFRKYLVAAGLVPWMLQGCSDMPGAGTGGGALEIVADIAGAVTVDTRTVEDEFGSYDSDYDFSEGDMIGFYSLRDETGADGGYSNLPLVYSSAENCFRNEALNVEYPNNFRYTFAYYPYSADNGETVDIYREDGSVEDVLVAGTGQITQGRIYLSFVHAFSMLIIVPGTGFETAAEEDTDASLQVRVVLKHGLSARVAKDMDAGSIDLVLEQDDAAETAFLATRRTDVSYTENGDPVTVCYSVILPEGAEVDYIEMTDNHGELQRIYSELDPLERGWRYPVNVSMSGTVPTVRPYEILPWTDGGTVELGGTYGIGTAPDFETWAAMYNRYTAGDEGDDVIAALSNYGEMTEGKWRFQLIADIDCSGLFGASELDVVVSGLYDEFDGRNHTLNGLGCTFAGVLGEGGKITDLNIDSPDITTDSTTPVGVVVLSMTGGEISMCDITSIRLETAGPAGAIAGSAEAGIISGNKVNGLLLGTSSSPDGLTGERTADVTCENNISSALIF